MLLQLREESNGALIREPIGEISQDRQVDVQLDALLATDPEREQRPFVLEASELALDRATTAGELARTLRLARGERGWPVRLDPAGRGLALAGGAAPLRSLALEVRSRERPLAVLAAARLVVAPDDGRSLAKRRDREDAAIHAPIVERAVVVALIRDGVPDLEPALAGSVDQPERERRLGILGRFDGPRDGKAGHGAHGSVDLVAVEPTRRLCASRQRSGGPTRRQDRCSAPAPGRSWIGTADRSRRPEGRSRR